jgi:hypothetical protein
MYVYKPQLKPHGQERVALGEPPVACRHVVPTYTSAGLARAVAGVGSWRWLYEGVRWEAAHASASLSEISTSHMPLRLPTSITLQPLPVGQR